MARDATARLYDVDEDSVVFEKFHKNEMYDQGMISFRARKGSLIDLDMLHESIWATRFSEGTRSGLIGLEVTTLGYVVASTEKTVLAVAGSEARFDLGPHPDDKHGAAFEQLLTLDGESLVQLTGRIDDYMGRWPKLLRTKPRKPRRILVKNFELLGKP